MNLHKNLHVILAFMNEIFNKRALKYTAGWVVLASIFFGCAAPQPAPVNPQQSGAQDGLQTVIVKTVAAAQTQTERVRPTSTQTPIPTKTATVTPTVTPTFLFLLPTQTSEFSSSSNSSPGSSGVEPTTDVSKFITPQPWKCKGLGQSPGDYTVFKPGEKFIVYWSVLNTGTEPWTINTIDFVYTAGFRPDNKRIQDFPRNAGPGGVVGVKAEFTAPKQTGEYNTFFSLTVGKRQFCGVKIIFVVAKK